MLSLFVFALSLLAQGPHAMNQRGEMVMGFDQDRTTHHFYLYPDGGAIDIQVRDAADTRDRDAIRSHLPHIATMFEAGNFKAPMLHSRPPRQRLPSSLVIEGDSVSASACHPPSGAESPPMNANHQWEPTGHEGGRRLSRCEGLRERFL